METTKTYVRRTISISPYIDGVVENGARSEFGGNASAFIAHSVLHYMMCQKCLHLKANMQDAILSMDSASAEFVSEIGGTAISGKADV